VRRTHIDYTSFGLPSVIMEYQADAASVYRITVNNYNLDTVYTSRRIIGLVGNTWVFDGSWNPYSVVNYDYDAAVDLQALPGGANAVQHDYSNYGTSFLAGRGNLTSITRFDATDPNNSTKAVKSEVGYNITGAVMFQKDPLGHQASVSYAESFSDNNNNRNTFAYPTTVTDPDGFSSSLQYTFDFGARTRVQGPPPAGQAQGVIQTYTYDNAARLQQVTTANNNSYRRYVYGPYYVQSYSTVNNVADDTYAIQTFDGAGRVIGAASNHPGSVGNYKAQMTVYDLLGRVVKQSNPTEITAGWAPTGDDSTGWLYRQQTYDWKGRPLVTTNPDTTTKTASYGGCGCAGGEVLTLTDEIGRKQKVYKDILGREAKTEIYEWNGTTVYSSSTNKYNALDQVIRLRRYVGAAPANEPDAEGSGYQTTTMTYDGHGRPWKRHAPEQQVDANNASSSDHTTYTYNADDTVSSIVDARGATASPVYNGRHLTTGVSYTAPAGITATPNVTYGYDAAGNRTTMSERDSQNTLLGSTTYQYDQLSRLTAETRYFGALSGSATGGNYTISYQYNLAGQVTSITDPFGAQVGYNHDTIGRVTSVTGSGYGNVSSYASNIQYRAWGSQKSVSYGDSSSATTAYNARMQPSSYTLSPSSFKLREQFQYYADGRLQLMTDLDDRNQDVGYPDTARHFSRAHSYDQAGRLTSASGSPAQFATFPYSQNFSYDAFNNATSHSGTYYYQTQNSDSGTFMNNRRQNWTYYADGQVKHTPLAYDANFNETMFRDWTYDAAGLLVQTRETITANNSVSTYVSSYDGDGQSIREYLYESPTTTNSYSVRSTALGGKVLTRLDNSGNKTMTIVEVDGLLTAVQSPSGGFQGLSWTHADPLGLSTAGDTKSVYDPQGNYIPWQHAPTAPPNSYPPFSPSFGGLGSAFGSSQNLSCNMDGMPTSCDRVFRALARGEAKGGSISSTGNPIAALLSLGINVTTSTDRTVAKVTWITVDNGPFALVELLRIAENGSGLTSAEAEVGYSLYNIDMVTLSLGSSMQPQNPFPGFDKDKLGEITKAIKDGTKLLSSGDCQKGLAAAGITVSDVNKIFSNLKARPDTDPSSQGYNIFDAEKSTDPQVQQFLQTEKGKGAGGFIYGQDIMLRKAFFNARGGAKIGGEVSRALALIHEVVHLTGKSDAFFGGSQKLNDVVIKACFNKLYGHKDLAIVGN
jgi:YD repeat-containing protein